jgi:hypothetical protein
MKLSQMTFTRRNFFALLLLGIASAVLFSRFALVESAAPQDAKRAFENKIPTHVPLKVKLKKEKEEKALDPKNKDWFRDIEIEVTNTSDKPIYFLSLNLEMPELIRESGALAIFPLRYGNSDLLDQNAKPLPEDKPIEPNGSVTFVVDEKNRSGYAAWRIRNQSEDPLKLQVSINHLSYGDGTGFTSLSAVPFPVKKTPEELGQCLERPRPPEEWARAPTLFSALYAQKLKTPAAFLPVNLFSQEDSGSNHDLASVLFPDICCPNTSCNKFKFSQYNCVCAVNVPTVLTTPCSDPVGICGTLIQLRDFCDFDNIGCPSFTFIACPQSLPTPTPTPSPSPSPSPFSCPATVPSNCSTGIAKDPCRVDFIDACPLFYHPERSLLRSRSVFLLQHLLSLREHRDAFTTAALFTVLCPGANYPRRGLSGIWFLVELWGGRLPRDRANHAVGLRQLRLVLEPNQR